MCDDDCWPVFLDEFISSLKVLPIPPLAGLVDVPEEKICRSIPQIEITGAEIKKSYLLDHAYVPVVDVSTDNLGIWNSKHRSTQTTTFFISGKAIGDEEDREYVVRKRRHNHVNAQPFGSVRKVVWTLFRPDGIAYRSLVSYNIAEGAQVKLTTHGNAKNLKQIYTRTYPSALRRMKELRRTLAPREVFPAMIAEQQSGVPGISGMQCLPRNKTQLYSMSRSKVPTSRKCGRSKNDSLMDELFRFSETAVEGKDLNAPFEGPTENLQLTPSQEDSSTSLNYSEAKNGVKHAVQQLDSSHAVRCATTNVKEVSMPDFLREMTPSEFQARLVKRLSAIPVEQRADVRIRIGHEMDVLFAQKVANEMGQVDESVRGSVMERLLAMVSP
ncbi:unnamed protein product [Toxocara canis]|uniref:DCUN1 domain-containing protein n=1 Tax=Toxocara canis TaxID=6265 RepID=A0A183VDY3_TOXCA|nr:unnamed protein product [Toxocara canis]